MNRRFSSLLPALSGLLLISLLTACGGGGGGGDDDEIGTGGGGVTLDKRITAARSTAATNNACTAIEPFYWEIGDRSDRITGNSEGNGSVIASTEMRIASASKWVFGAYVLQKRNNVLTEADVKALTMRTGYSNHRYRLCIKSNPAQQETLTVGDCFAASASGSANSDYVAGDDGKFHYNGGHFQRWAMQNGLQDDVNDDLTVELRNQFASAFLLDFDSPQLAAGLYMNSLQYAFFLRSILTGDLFMLNRLGTEAVCTNPATCPDQATYTPIPSDENWHYSLGHWVEDDPEEGDGAFSSPGYFGFYPWIDSSKRWYGVLARVVEPATLQDILSNGTAQSSVECGRRIRKAWITGVAQD